MNNELLNKILPYVGYGLKAYYEGDIVDVLPSSSGTNRINTEMLLTASRDGTYHYKPILFPPDCLTREIETEHGKEIPLIEMAKIACPGEYYKWEIKNNCAVSGITLVSMDQNGSIQVYRIISSDGYTHPRETCNQCQLFQYMYSRHIAFNLDSDKYVSVESLEKNPYADRSKR